MRLARFHVLGGLALGAALFCVALWSCGTPPPSTVAPSLSAFSVAPSSVVSGVPTTVTWSFSLDNTPNPAAACAIEGVGAITDGIQSSLTLTTDTTFTLRCSNAGGESVREVRVTVVQPVAPALASFSANPTAVMIGRPTDVTWTWSYSNTPMPAPTCSISRGVGTVTSGAATSVTLSNNATFTLTCTNVAGTATQFVSINAVPATVAPSISTFVAIPSSVVVDVPTSILFSWAYSAEPTPAPTCTIDQGVGTATNPTTTTSTVTQSADLTYTLTCTNSAGTGTRQVTVAARQPVAPALNTFVATPSSVYSGVSTSVTWRWTYSNSPDPAPTCSIDQGVGTLTSGTARDVTINADTVFTLTCTNGGGSSTRPVTITTTQPGAPVIATFTASPSSVVSGVTTNIRWNWTYSGTPNPAPSCSIDQAVGTVTDGQVTPVNLTAAQTYTLTCTNVAGNGTAQVTINVVPVGNGITNGTFETGTLSGWTTAGTVSVLTGGHSGTYTERSGSTIATAGDSSVSQTFTVPAGATTLSFWYKVVCPDSITFDWATATLRNNSTGVTTTVLNQVCSNTGLWQQVTAPVNAGTSYTLTLISHDDNYASDPTYTLYDDVTLL